MRYMGNKNKIAKDILPIMLSHRKPDQWWVEPFVGGGNMIDKVDGKRLGADLNPYLIEALRLIRDDPHSIPDLITENDYQRIKEEMKVDGLTGFVGFAMSFGGKWFGGYARDIKGTKGSVDNMLTQTRRGKSNAIKQSPFLKGVILATCDYSKLYIPRNSLIYCDPPYKDTTKYKSNFDHDKFWDWCIKKTKDGHTVFVSEYEAPDSFECVWSKEVTTTLYADKPIKSVERLFVHKSQCKNQYKTPQSLFDLIG